MTDEELAQITKLLDVLRDGLAGQISQINDKCDAVSKRFDSLSKRRDADEDDDGQGNVAATKTAADAVSRSELEVLRAQLRDLQTRQPRQRTQADRNAFAAAQARADVAYRTIGEGGAPPPMQGEELLDYECRLHFPLQRHSAKWKGVQLAAIARDPSTFAGVCDAIRADAVAYGLNPPDLPPFQHREITETGPGGHKITRFVGNGSIFAQMTRPTRHVLSIGAKAQGRSGNGAVYSQDAI
jgi:hypothetical protein